MEKLLAARTSRELADVLGVRHEDVMDYFKVLEYEVKVARELYLPVETYDDAGVYLKRMPLMFRMATLDHFIKLGEVNHREFVATGSLI